MDHELRLADLRASKSSVYTQINQKCAEEVYNARALRPCNLASAGPPATMVMIESASLAPRIAPKTVRVVMAPWADVNEPAYYVTT